MRCCPSDTRAEHSRSSRIALPTPRTTYLHYPKDNILTWSVKRPNKYYRHFIVDCRVRKSLAKRIQWTLYNRRREDRSTELKPLGHIIHYTTDFNKYRLWSSSLSIILSYYRHYSTDFDYCIIITFIYENINHFVVQCRPTIIILSVKNYSLNLTSYSFHYTTCLIIHINTLHDNNIFFILHKLGHPSQR